MVGKESKGKLKGPVYLESVVVLGPDGDETSHSLSTQPFPHPHTGRMGKRMKVKLMHWDKNSLIIENTVQYNNNNGKY